ncbi:hypothetical protein DWW52_01240 [Odoribacter sp. AF15-53]|nr:hypothetical protein DWW52_01240 [Odoribacter sp. AF15-53]
MEIMNRGLFIYVFLGLMLIWGCDEEDKEIPVIKPNATGVYVDERDGTEYGWVRYGDLEWMTSNMRYAPESGLYGKYEDDAVIGEGSMQEAMYEKYGYWYDYNAALLVAPKGWRLPTDEDWQKLEMALGMSSKEIAAEGFRGNYEGELLQQGDEGTGIQLAAGGFYSEHTVAYTEHWRFRGVYGFFWTATEDPNNSGFIFYRKVAYNSTQVFRASTMKTNWLNVRCCRDAQ